MKIVDLHTELIGKLCVLTEMGVELEKEYKALFDIGNYERTNELRHYQMQEGKYKMVFMFIDEKPITHNGLILYCLKEVGVGVSGDWHWFALDQLVICE